VASAHTFVRADGYAAWETGVWAEAVEHAHEIERWDPEIDKTASKKTR
jgi:hypothetical protein